MTKVLVTGGMGFIGSHTVDYLLETGYDVNVLDTWWNTQFIKKKSRGRGIWHPTDKYVNFYNTSVTNEQGLKKAIAGCDVVIHLAGILGTNETIFKYRPDDVAEVNLVGLARVLHYANKSKTVKRVIFSSTPNVPWLNPYKVTKRACEGFVTIYRRYFGMKIAMFRFRNVYGPRERWLQMRTGAPYVYQKVVPTFIYQALRNEPLMIYGDGNQSSDYIYVDDVVRCIELATDSDVALDYYQISVGTGKQTSVNKLADMIIKLTDSSSVKEHIPMRSGEALNTHITTNTTPMKRLGVKNTMSLDEGLKKTIKWVRREMEIG